MNNEPYKKSLAIGLILMFVLLSMVPITRAQNQGQQNNQPTMQITRPRLGYIYHKDEEIKNPFGMNWIPIIYGKITFSVKVYPHTVGGYISDVEFEFDGESKGQAINEHCDPTKSIFDITFFDSQINTGKWVVKAIAHENNGDTQTASITIQKLNTVTFNVVAYSFSLQSNEISFTMETGETITMLETSFLTDSSASITMDEILSDGIIDLSEIEIINANTDN